MDPWIVALIEIYEYEIGSTENKEFVGKILLEYRSENYPTPKDFADKNLEEIGKIIVRQKGIKAKISVEIPDSSPTVYQLREKIIIVDKTFIINLFKEE